MSDFDHYHDMDHDGDHDLKDSGMFHDMEDGERVSPRDEFICTGTSWTWKDYLIRIIAVFVLVSPASMVMKGTLPCNFFTVIISLGMLVGGIALLFDVIEMLR